MSAEHGSDQNSIIKIAMNLTAACFISGAIIAATFFLTNPIAQVKAIEIQQESMQALVKDADSFKEIEGKEKWFAAEKDGKTIAYVVPGEAKGYGGSVILLVAIDTEGKVIDYTCTKHNETPGLGDKAARAPFKDQFAGKTSAQLEVTKDASNTENIQALTGATISSRAFTKAVKQAVDEVLQFEGGK
ncbi:MAG: FMN-binding protein [Clostridiaceae bacterium]